METLVVLSVLLSLTPQPLLANTNPVPPETPLSGVRVYLAYRNHTLSNFTVIHAGQFDDVDRNPPDGILDPLWCQSANPSNNIGVWYRPANNRTLPTQKTDPLYVQYFSGQVGLYRTTGIAGYEGIYQCDIPDENWVNHTLYVGVYRTPTYNNFTGPMVDPTMQFSLVSSRDAEPPVFTLSFNSTQGPPTEVNCTVDGTPVTVPDEDLSRTVLEVNLPSVVEVGVTFRERQGGVYNCTVTLIGVNDNSSLFKFATNFSSLPITVAKTPQEVAARRTGLSTLLVSWAAATEAVAGYEVFCAAGGGSGSGAMMCNNVSLVTSQNFITLTGLSPTLDYSVSVVAFGSGSNLPSPRSSTVEINYPVNITGRIRTLFPTAIAGSSYAVRCTITVDMPVPRLRVAWADTNGTELTSTRDFNTTANGTEASLELLFDHLMLSNAGLYTCLATAEDDDGGSLSTSDQHTIVVQAAKPPVLVRDSPAGKHIEGTNLTLTCSTTVSDTSVLTVEAISWSSSSSGGITQNSSQLTLTPTTEQSGGIFLSTLSIYTLTIEEDNLTDYTCTISLASLSNIIIGNTANSTFTVMVEVLPTPRTIISAGCSPIIGQDYSLTCITSVDQQVSAGLSLVLLDTESGFVIATGSHAGMAFMTPSPQSTVGLTLFFHSLNSSSQGNYTCVANLSLPGIQRTTSSSVAHSLVPLVLSNPMVDTRTEGDPVAGLNYSIVCRASAGVNSNTLPSATWLAPDGTDLQAVSTNGTFVTYSQQGYLTIATLQFQPLFFHHGGVYECVASILNTQGATSTGRSRQQIPLTVQIPPPSVMITVDSMEPLYAGTPLTLTCAITLSNAVDISILEVNASWSRGGLPVSTRNGSRVTKTFLPLPGSKNSFILSLQFFPLEYVSDSGMYNCLVSVTPRKVDNQYIKETSVRQSTAITVLDLPEPVITINQTGSYTIGTILNLFCSAKHVEGLISPPTIIWSWETEPLDTDGSGGEVSTNGSMDGPLLEFNPLMASNRGVYRCDVTIQVPIINLYLNASREIFIDPQRCSNTTFFSTNVTLVKNNQKNATGYNFTCQRNTPSSSAGDEDIRYLQNDDSCIVVGLSPSTAYTCNVTVLFQQEERPLTQCLFTTAEAAPGPVSVINTTILSPMEVTVSWSPVSQENTHGEIRFYWVFLKQYGGVELNRTMVDASAILEAKLSGLEGLRPYTVSVVAVNGAPQPGVPRTEIFFTKEGAPPSPTNITTQRLNGTHMNISWSPIPLTESRGFIQNYTITYQRLSQTVKRQVLSVSVPGGESSVVIGGLDPASAYMVSVGATTSAGQGEVRTINISPPSPETALFQLRGRRSPSSGAINSGGYFEFTRSALVEAINNRCSCGFSASSITQEQLICDQLAPAEFIYRAAISSYSSHSTDQLLDYIEQWVLSGVTLMYNGSQVTFDSKCLVRISSYDDQLCLAAVANTQNPSTSSVPSRTFAPPQTQPAALFVGVATGCILLCIAVVGIILMVCLLVQRRMRKNRVAPFDNSSQHILLVETDLPMEHDDKSRGLSRARTQDSIYTNRTVTTELQ